LVSSKRVKTKYFTEFEQKILTDIPGKGGQPGAGPPVKITRLRND
jgi:hypothetical protein